MDFDHHIKFECLNSLLEDYLFVFYLLKEFPEIIQIFKIVSFLNFKNKFHKNKIFKI